MASYFLAKKFTKRELVRRDKRKNRPPDGGRSESKLDVRKEQKNIADHAEKNEDAPERDAGADCFTKGRQI